MAESTEPRLPPGQHLVAADKWPTIGEKLPLESDRPWTLTLGGLVEQELSFSLDELQNLPMTEMTLDIHCVTRWSKYDVTFRGVLLSDLFEKAGVKNDAQFVSFVARSARNHSSSLRVVDAMELQVLIALESNGQPLPIEKGGPIRSIVPRRYFYKSVKWVERIELLDTDRLGYWEGETGYHNEADPWQEQRFISQSVDKKRAKQLIESRDFSNQDLLSIELANHELSNLKAQGALLRNANFSGCTLVDADFSSANLSNANFKDADLTNANFSGADLEGADLAGSNLTAANFSGCSLFGSTFCRESSDLDPQISEGAIFSAETVLDEKTYEVLTPTQFNFVQTQLAKFR